MFVNNGQILFIAFAFLVPGFIAQSVKTLFFPAKEKELTLTILGYLTFSGVNYGVWVWLFYLIIFQGYFIDRPLLIAVFCFVVIFISPIVLGLISGVLYQRNTLRRLMRIFRLNPMHECPTAWDWKFSQIRGAEIVHVTLSEGSQYRGLYCS